MALFEIGLAYNVRVYGIVEVEAETIEEAYELVRRDAASEDGGVWNDVTDVDWETGTDYTIIDDDIDLMSDGSECIVISAEELKERL